MRGGREQKARELYARAAAAEQRAVADLDTLKTRTLGISSVSTVSLYYKAAMFECAEELACRWLPTEELPLFAKEQLRNLLQSIWSEQTRKEAPVRFEPGQVLVSVQGGEIVSGGAPLDLIVEKVKIVQSLFHRTAEFLSGLAHRRRGAPSKSIQDSLPSVALSSRARKLSICSRYPEGVSTEVVRAGVAFAGGSFGLLPASPSGGNRGS